MSKQPNFLAKIVEAAGHRCELNYMLWKRKMVAFTKLLQRLPLAPAFAFINYKCQGQTFQKAIVDLGEGVTSIRVYVMLSRVRRLEELLILRPFKESILDMLPFVRSSSDLTSAHEKLSIACPSPKANHSAEDDAIYLFSAPREVRSGCTWKSCVLLHDHRSLAHFPEEIAQSIFRLLLCSRRIPLPYRPTPRDTP